MKVKIIRIVFPIFLIAWMALIFILSSQTATESSSISSGFTDKLFSVIYPGYFEMSEEAQLAILSGFSFLIRKSAHFTLYFILGVFSFFTFVTYSRFELWRRGIISSVICIVFSVTDEFHQIFVPGRSGELRDILIDSTGSVIAVFLLILFVRFIFRKKDRCCKCVKKSF